MNQSRFFIAICLFAFILVIFSTCKKIDFHDPAQKCRIVETLERIITYDEWGNPKLVVYKEDPNGTGHPTFYFLYNSKHQLIEYGGGNQHFLTLNEAGQAIRDTMIMNYAGQDDRIAHEIYYDVFGRISKMTEDHYHSGGEPIPLPREKFVAEYKYDKRGNLITHKSDDNGNQILRKYDHKTSIYRTHPVFMFIHHNYSRNNLIPEFSTYEYNSAGLPDKFEGSLLEGSSFTTHIIYECANKNEEGL